MACRFPAWALVLALLLASGGAGALPTGLRAEPPWPSENAMPGPRSPGGRARYGLARLAGSPRWLWVGLEHRARFEHASTDARTHAPGTGIFLRTVAAAELRLLPLVLGVEVLDARAWVTEQTVLNTTHVNPVDVLRAYGALRLANVFTGGDALQLHAGRLALDLGSRRLLARNDFRNTINSFTGVDAAWTGHGHEVRALAVVPVLREPSAPTDLRRATPVADRENTDALLLAAMHRWPALPGGARVEAYALVLAERDGDVAHGADRRLVTPGLRVVRSPAEGRLDVQAEVMFQAGLSRASTRDDDTRDLKHAAASTHVSVGYTFRLPGSPRLVALHDFASGDVSRADGWNQRFDPLFGARRFDFGPTGLWGVMARSNIQSPGARLEGQHRGVVDGAVAWRAAWLASAADGWVPLGTRPASALKDTWVGQQVEARARWHVVPGMVTLEGGAALLWGGSVARDAMGDPAPWLAYSQVTSSL